MERDKKDYTAWTSPDGRTRRQIDYIIVRERFQNAIRKCGAIKGWRGNYRQQRQHAVVKAEIQISWALQYIHKQRTNNTETIRYDRHALKHNTKALADWARDEGDLADVKLGEKHNNERIWRKIKTKIQNKIEELYPENKKIIENAMKNGQSTMKKNN